MTNEPSSQISSTPLDDGPPQWEKGTRYMALGLLVVGIALALLALVPVADMVALGFVIAFLIYIPTRSLMRRRPGTHYSLAVVALYFVTVVIIVVLIAAAIPYFVDAVGQLSVSFEDARARFDIPQREPAGQLVEALSQVLVMVARALASVTTGLLGMIGLLGSALLFSLFLMLDINRSRGVLADWVPLPYHREIHLLLRRLDGVWVGYITAQVIYGALLGVSSLVEYVLLGVPFPVVMSVVTGVISLIPTIGGLVSSVIVATFCLFFGSSVLVDMSNGTFALLVVIIDILKTQITYNFIALPIVGRYVKLPVSVVFVGVLVGLALGSIILAFLVVPILSTLRILGSYILSKAMEREPFPDEVLPESPQPGFFSQLFASSSQQGE